MKNPWQAEAPAPPRCQTCSGGAGAFACLAFPAVALIFATSLCAQRAAEDPTDSLARELKKMVEIFVTIDREAADPVDPDVLFYQGAIPGMLRTLDPHSIFFDPGQFEQLKQMEKSETKGFGSIVSVLPGRVYVLQAMPGTPSAKAGLAAGDEILAINNYDLSRLDFEQLVQLLGAARQQTAHLDVRHPGNSRLFRLTLTPELVDSPSVDRAFMVAPGVGYLRVTSFDGPTGKLVKETIEKLGGAELKGLVLDLRNNPGGVAQSAAEIASLFLQPDQLVFTVKGRNAKTEEVRVPKFSKPYTFPMAILVNGKSASASEIVTGALQDHDRAVVLGEPSYGKGLVQQVYPLSSGTGTALTTAFYYTPSGRNIQHPLHGGQLDVTTSGLAGVFHTDSGRTVAGGGGIQPDEIVVADVSRLQLVLDASGVLTAFAGEYLRSHEVKGDFVVTPALIDELRVYLADRRIQPSPSDLASHRAWIESRLKQELFTLALGVAKGDEIDLRRDPVVTRALKRIGVAP
jgi:carboxyl-terminal processing protease